jgi:hypothetical protein
MKTHKYLSILLIVIFLVIPTLSVQGAVDGWQAVADGIDYQKFHLTSPRPIDIFVARMDRSNLNATIESSIAQGSLAAGRETVRGMAARYDGAINYWGQTWGGRNQVAVAINGFFFDGVTYTPWSGQIQSGWYAKRYFETTEEVSGFVWTLNRQAFIGECIDHPADKQVITYLDYLDGTKTQKFQGINVPRSDDSIIIYTPQYAASTGTSDVTGPDVEVVVEMERPTMILPPPAMAVGTVRAIRENQGNALIPFDHIVISAQGLPVETVLGRLNVGDQIGISQELKNCAYLNKPEYPWTKAYAGVGGDKYFLQASKYVTTDGNVPDAHTVIAYGPDYVFFVVTDRWNPGVSEGIAYSELATFLVNTLGATDAVSQDHGGSSTMVVNGEVVNNTYCNFNDCRNKNATNLDGAEIPGKSEHLGQIPLAEWNADTLGDEALVANGMLMVVNQPRIQSNAYAPDDPFPLAAGAILRLGPGSNYAGVLTVPSADQGTVVGHANGLNGVYAKGQYWWPVNYNGTIGWTPGIPVANQAYRAYLAFIGQFAVGTPPTSTTTIPGQAVPNPFFSPGSANIPDSSGR